MIWKLARLTRSLRDVLTIMERLTEAKAGFKSLTEAIPCSATLLQGEQNIVCAVDSGQCLETNKVPEAFSTGTVYRPESVLQHSSVYAVVSLGGYEDLMVAKYNLTCILGVFALGLATSAHVNASSLSQTYAGTLDSESGTAGSVVLESFSLTALSDVTIYTTSYGGGMNLDGTTAGPGGFQPSITLYNNTGFVVANQSASFSPIANTDPSTGLKLDGYLLDSDAPAGTYYVTLTDWQNQMSIMSTGLNLSEAAYLQFSGPGGTSFLDVQGNARSGAYALNISGTPLTTTPEPATALLIIPGLAAAFLLARKRRTAEAERVNS